MPRQEIFNAIPRNRKLPRIASRVGAAFADQPEIRWLKRRQRIARVAVGNVMQLSATQLTHVKFHRLPSVGSALTERLFNSPRRRLRQEVFNAMVLRKKLPGIVRSCAGAASRTSSFT